MYQSSSKSAFLNDYNLVCVSKVKVTAVNVIYLPPCNAFIGTQTHCLVKNANQVKPLLEVVFTLRITTC